jgi:CRISPR-associated exonuclease Cas4
LKTNLTITDVVENAFCPKFTYYELVLGLKQYEGKQGSVKAGREYHNRHSSTNLTYVPKNIKGRKLTETQLFSRTHLFSGKIDEAIETAEEVIIIERKYSDHVNLGATIKTQLGLLSILVEENLKKKVRKAIVVFERTRRLEIQVDITEEIKNLALSGLQRTKQVLTSGLCPVANYSNRCLTCCYRKVCEVGSLRLKPASNSRIGHTQKVAPTELPPKDDV